MSDVKACPFCGSEDVLEQDTGINIPYLLCNDCHAQGPHSFSPALRWNFRAEQSELTTLREQVKVLREALEWLDNEMDCRDDEFGGCLFSRQDFGIVREALEQTKSKDEDPEKLAKLIAARVNGFGLSSAHKLVFGLGTLDNIINAEPADLDAIFGKGSIKSIHLRKYLDDPVAVERLRERLQTKPKEVE